MHDEKRSRRERIGFILLAPAALVLAISCLGCASSSPKPTTVGSAAPASVTVTLINNCSAPDNLINVQMNTDTAWMSGGVSKCAAGALCAVAPGTYKIDLGTKGLNFFSGANPGSATKAEVTYATELSFDISVITQSGNCPNSCKDSSCCAQGFNEAVKITTTPASRCLLCNGVSCPDAFHFPTDNSKQTNASAATAMTIEFCPKAACPALTWRTCDTTEMAACRNLANQPCVGELTVCCPPQPSAPKLHSCFCEAGTWCAQAPNPYNACGKDASKYCYVPNQ